MTPDERAAYERRQSPQAARIQIEEDLPHKSREDVLGHFAEAIRWANKRNPEGWSVTLKVKKTRYGTIQGNGVSLNVGKYQALLIRPRLLEITINKDSCSKGLSHTLDAWPLPFASGYLPDSQFLQIWDRDFHKARPLIAGLSQDLVEHAAIEQQLRGWPQWHSPGVLDYLDEILGAIHGPGYEKLPRPPDPTRDSESEFGSKPADQAQVEMSITPAGADVTLCQGGQRTVQDEAPQATLGQALAESPHLTAEEDIANAEGQLASVEGTTRTALIEARRGQGKYRRNLIEVWERCSVTQCAQVTLLRASHIKPWRESSSAERLDKFNGLLLVPNLDGAFDRGLISFTGAGEILISPSLSDENCSHLGIKKELRLLRVHPENQPFLVFHRKLHGFGA
jgi:hypothetical protein